MLESMRNQAQSWLAKLILGGIALSFALWGVGDWLVGNSDEPVATINEKPVTGTDFYLAFERQKNVYRQMFGGQYSRDFIESIGLRESTLQTLINRYIMLDIADELGLTAPEQVVLSSVRENPAFQSASGFDPERYRILTRNLGFTSAQDYEEDLRLNIMVDALQRAMVQSARVSEREIRERFNREYEQRVIAAIIIDPDSLKGDINIDSEQAKAWYESHKENYFSPMRIRINAVDIDPAMLARDVMVEEAEVRQSYEDHLNEYAVPEKRKASHILVKNGEQAQQKVADIQARLEAGEDFASVARETSEDPGSAEKGGDLGWVKAGDMVPEFEQALFSLARGDVSDVIESQFGYHIIRLADIQEATSQPYEEVKDFIKAGLINARAAEEAYTLSQDLDEALGMEDSLKAAAASVNLKFTAIEPVSMEEAIAQPLLEDQGLRAKVFATSPGAAVEIEETANGHFIAFEVVERIEPEQLPFARVAARVMEDARRDAAEQKAREMAERIQLSEQGSPDKLAQDLGQAKYISKPVRRNGEGDTAGWLTPEVLEQAFSTDAEDWVDRTLVVPQGIAAVRVEEVIAASREDFASKKDEIAKAVQQAKGAVRFNRWMASVRDRYEIKTNDKVLERF